MKFEEVYEEWKEYASKRHKKQSFITLESNFKSRILPYFRDKSIYDITRKDIMFWENQVSSFGFKYSYTSKLYINFSCFFDYCCKFYNLESNPVREVGNFKRLVDEKRTDFYNIREFNQFIKAVEHPVYKQFFNLMFYTGTRPGEAMALKFSDIQGDYISITKNLTTKGGRNIDTPKNQSSIRKIRIDKQLKYDLFNLKYYYSRIYGAFSNDYFIFGGIKPLAPTTINRYKFIACDKANIRPITLHQFRHSHATLLLQNGVMINEVSRRLGHNDVSTTLDIYAHTDLSQEKKCINTLNSIRFNFSFTLESIFKKFKTLLKH